MSFYSVPTALTDIFKIVQKIISFYLKISDLMIYSHYGVIFESDVANIREKLAKRDEVKILPPLLIPRELNLSKLKKNIKKVNKKLFRDKIKNIMSLKAKNSPKMRYGKVESSHLDLNFDKRRKNFIEIMQLSGPELTQAVLKATIKSRNIELNQHIKQQSKKISQKESQSASL